MKNVRQTNINIHRDSWVEINLENISHRTPGFSGADLENILNQSATIAVSAGVDAIITSDFAIIETCKRVCKKMHIHI